MQPRVGAFVGTSLREKRHVTSSLLVRFFLVFSWIGFEFTLSSRQLTFSIIFFESGAHKVP